MMGVLQGRAAFMPVSSEWPYTGAMMSILLLYKNILKSKCNNVTP